MTTTKAKRQPRKFPAVVLGDLDTPHGQPGVLIECHCGKHRPGQTMANMRAAAGPGLAADPFRIHNYVLMAWHPVLSKAPQIRADGPWRVVLED